MARKKRVVGGVGILAVLVAIACGYWGWRKITGPSAAFTEESVILYIPQGAGFDQVVDSLKNLGAIQDEVAFRWLCERKNYVDRVKAGRYRLPNGIGMNALVNKLRAGEQEPVKVTFTNVKNLRDLAGLLAQRLEPDSAAFIKAFQDPEVQHSAGLNERTFIGLFIPDTYEFWWTTTPERFVERMKREYDAFWNSDRSARAKALGLEPIEVSTLASIVQAETVQRSDASRIAGVYLNRLRIGMPLQADPTLKYALGLDSISRILDRDKTVDSPYNTYKNLGLPPGPINMPEARSINAVLQAEKHDFLYFCARADLSGHSEFSKSYAQHLVYARRYQRALNERRIYR